MIDEACCGCSSPHVIASKLCERGCCMWRRISSCKSCSSWGKWDKSTPWLASISLIVPICLPMRAHKRLDAMDANAGALLLILLRLFCKMLLSMSLSRKRVLIVIVSRRWEIVAVRSGNGYADAEPVATSVMVPPHVAASVMCKCPVNTAWTPVCCNWLHTSSLLLTM